MFNDYQLHLRRVDPTLTDVELLSQELDRQKYNYRTYQSWYRDDPEKLDNKVREIIKNARAAWYRQAHLNKTDSQSWSAGRCYTKGYELWVRIDGQPLIQQDLDALNCLCYGQSTGTTNKPGDLVARVDWACDSGD